MKRIPTDEVRKIVQRAMSESGHRPENAASLVRLADELRDLQHQVQRLADRLRGAQ